MKTNKVVFDNYNDLTLQLLREWNEDNNVTLVADYETILAVLKPFLYNKRITVSEIELYEYSPSALYVMTIYDDGELVVYPFEGDHVFEDKLVYVHISDLDTVLEATIGNDVVFVPYRYKDEPEDDEPIHSEPVLCRDCDETECEHHPWHNGYHKSEVLSREDHGKAGINMSTYDEDVDDGGPLYTVNYSKSGNGSYQHISYSSNKKFDKNEIEKLLRQCI